MFVIVEIKDTISLHPSTFMRDIHEVLMEEIDAKYANKVMTKVGLCICAHSIVDAGDAMVYAGDGSAHCEATFTLLVFRPFIGEVLVGTIKSADRTGIWVSVEFFHDIFVPASHLPSPSIFNEEEQVWVWQYPTEDEDDDEDASPQYVMDLGESIRVRVMNLKYGRPRPSGPHTVEGEGESGAAASGATTEGGASAGGAGAGAGSGALGAEDVSMDAEGVGESKAKPAGKERGEKGGVLAGGEVTDGSVASTQKKKALAREPALTVLATSNDDGLGLVSWWDFDEDAEGVEGEEGEEGGEPAE